MATCVNFAYWCHIYSRVTTIFNWARVVGTIEQGFWLVWPTSATSRPEVTTVLLLFTLQTSSRNSPKFLSNIPFQSRPVSSQFHQSLNYTSKILASPLCQSYPEVFSSYDCRMRSRYLTLCLDLNQRPSLIL